MKKIRIGIFFGGRSREREISFAGGRTVYDNLDKTLFQVVPIFVDSFAAPEGGNFVLLDWKYVYKGSIRDFFPPTNSLPPSPHDFQIYAESLGQLDSRQQDELIRQIGQRIAPHQLKQHIDFAFLALHGAYSEDGSIQGLLQYLHIPYTASGILPSAIGMDKAFQKTSMQGAGFQLPDFQCLQRHKWLKQSTQERQFIYQQIKAKLGLPFVIKAANQGSSIGARILKTDDFQLFEQFVYDAFFIEQINKQDWQGKTDEERIQFIRQLIDIRGGIGLPVWLENEAGKENVIYHPEELYQRINQHFAKDNNLLQLHALDKEHEVIVEEFLRGKEFSCIVVREENGQATALPPTEIVKGTEIYDYRSKYLAGLSRKVTPINLPVEQVQAIRQSCVRLFNYFKFNTYARIDGFITKENTIYLNDPNTTSGMLPSSFFFHQAAEIGLNPSQFLTFIIRQSLQERIRTTTNSFSVKHLLKTLDNNIFSLQTQAKQKKKIAVILGGYSSERHISVESGRNIYEKLASSDKYSPLPIFLTGDEQSYQLYEIPISILLKDNADDIKDKVLAYQKSDLLKAIKADCANITEKYAAKDAIHAPRHITVADLANKVAAVFIALHGRPGEDGALQRELERYGLPYNGSGVASSQITIDKYATNQLLRKHGFKLAQQFLVYKKDWQANQSAVLEEINNRFNYPIIAKPVDDGCSSAVKKIKEEAEFIAYTNLIFREKQEYTNHPAAQSLGLKPKEEFPKKTVFLVEELIEKGDAHHFLEITGGLLTHRKNGHFAYEMFEPSETLASEEVLSLEEKFLAGQGQNLTPARYAANAERQKEISEKVKADLKRVAQLLNIEGYARIDAFVKIYASGAVDTYVIEVNSLPGMTPATAIFHQCALNAYTPYEFIDKILEYAMQTKDNISIK